MPLSFQQPAQRVPRTTYAAPGTGTSNCRNLTQQVNNTRENNAAWVNYSAGNYYWDGTNQKTYWPATYFWKSSPTTDMWQLSNYTKVEIRDHSNIYWPWSRKPKTIALMGYVHNQEIQNFANWYLLPLSRPDCPRWRWSGFCGTR